MDELLEREGLKKAIPRKPNIRLDIAAWRITVDDEALDGNVPAMQ